MAGQAPDSAAPKQNWMATSETRPCAAPVAMVKIDHATTTAVSMIRVPTRSAHQALRIPNAP